MNVWRNLEKKYLIILLLVGAPALSTISSLLTKYCFNSFSEMPLFTQYLLLFSVVTFLAYSIDVIGRRTVFHSSRRLEFVLQYKLINRFCMMNPAKSEAAHRGGLCLKFFRDISFMGSTVRDIGPNLISACVSMVVAGIIVAVEGNFIIIVTLLFLFVFSFMLLWPLRKTLVFVNKNMMEKQNVLMTHLYTFLTALPSLKSYTCERYFSKTPRKAFKESCQCGEALDTAVYHFENRIQFIQHLTACLLMGVTGYMACENRLTIGDVVMYQMLFMQAFSGMCGLFNFLPFSAVFKESMTSLKQAYDFEGLEHDEGKKVFDFKGEVELKNVSFHYAGSECVINNLSLKVQPGKLIILTGENGSGKTTLIKLLCAFMQPTSGAVLFDGVESEHINRTVLREKISIVFQDPILFYGTLRENMTLGKHVNESELNRLIALTGLQAVIDSRENGLDTLIGENGGGLSGGERQKIAIVRALLRKPSLLILDELTNHLDQISCAKIQELVESINSRCAVVIITHDPMILRLTPNVINLKKGEFSNAGCNIS